MVLPKSIERYISNLPETKRDDDSFVAVGLLNVTVSDLALNPGTLDVWHYDNDQAVYIPPLPVHLETDGWSVAVAHRYAGKYRIVVSKHGSVLEESTYTTTRR